MKKFPEDIHIQRDLAKVAISSGRIECPGIMLYSSFFEAVQFLTDEEAGQLIRAVCAYRFKADVADFSDNRVLAIAFADAKAKADADLLKYVIRTLQNKYNASGKKTVDATGKKHVDREEFETWFDNHYRAGNDDDLDEYDESEDFC